MPIKPKKLGLGLQIRTYFGDAGESYLVFKTQRGSYHVFQEVEAKQAARSCGASRKTGTTRQMWDSLWRKGRSR